MTTKERIFLHCISCINHKLDTLEQMLAELNESATSDTKSSAGDKHETARAMIQIEQDNIRKQINELITQKNALEKIDLTLHTSQIINGSLIKTNKGHIFLSIGLGKLMFNGLQLLAISAQSPLGNRLLGLKIGQSVEMNGSNYFIEHIE